jgi:L-amino acid N-acyltransferase
MTVTIRAATRADVPGILAIYNDAVLTTTAAWDETPHTLAMREAWYDLHMERGQPIFVAEADAHIVGWSALGNFRDKIGYRYTVENSVYVAAEQRGRGLGKLLIPPLISAARERGWHTIVAGIEASNEASIRLHARFGFVSVAHFRQVGFKFGRWLDMVFMQVLLD